MDGEVFFRRSVIGGFNREDVLRYISKVTVDQAAADKTAEQLKKAEEEIAVLKKKAADDAASIDALEKKLEAAQADLQAANTRLEEQQSKTSYDSTADKLMRDSMTYADRYVESAELMARSIREELSQKVGAADAKVTEMLYELDTLSTQSSALGDALQTLKDDLGDISRSFEQKDA